MKRVLVSPLQLSDLVHVQKVDVLLPNSELRGPLESRERRLASGRSLPRPDASNGELNSFQLIYDVDFYYAASPRHMQVFGYTDGAPLLDLKWDGRTSPPLTEVLVDASTEVVEEKVLKARLKARLKAETT